MAKYSINSHYHGGYEGFLTPVDFKPVEQGYKCDQCWFFGVSAFIMNRHSRTHEDRTGYHRCCVQRINDCTRTPYIGVLPRGEELRQEGRNDPERRVRPIDALAAMTALHAGFLLEPEEGRNLGLFYQLSGFVTGPGEVNIFENVDQAAYVAPLSDDHEDYEAIEQFRLSIIRYMRSINSADISLRFAVSAGRRPFKVLETEKSILEYSAVMSRFGYFMTVVVNQPIPDRKSVV